MIGVKTSTMRDENHQTGTSENKSNKIIKMLNHGIRKKLRNFLLLYHLVFL